LLAYDLYKGPYNSFTPYRQSQDTSREDAIRRLLNFSVKQPSVSGSSFNDMVNADLQNQYKSIYGDNVPQNTTLKIPQISDNPNYPALDLYSPEIPVREELPKLPSQFKGDMLLNYKSPSIPVPKNRSYLDAIKDWSDRASMAAGEIITGIDRPDKPKIGDFEVTSRGFMSDKDKLPGNIKINLPESFTSDRPVNLNSADLSGGLVGFLAGGEFNVGSKVFQGAENAIGQALAKLGAKSSKVANIPNLTQSAIKVGGATVPYEYSRSIANDREFDTGEAAQAGATNAALGVILGRLGSALDRDRTPAPAPTEFRMPEYKEQDMSAFTPEELANIRSQSSPGEMITPETVTTKEVAAAQRTLRNTPNIEKANKILDEFPELESEFPHFRLKQGDTVVLPNGKEGIVKTADKMIIQVDVDGKTASIGRKVVKVPEVKAEMPEVIIPEVPEMTTSEIKQQPVVNDVSRLNNRSGAETFADENIPAVSVKQEPIVAQRENIPKTLSLADEAFINDKNNWYKKEPYEKIVSLVEEQNKNIPKPDKINIKGYHGTNNNNLENIQKNGFIDSIPEEYINYFDNVGPDNALYMSESGKDSKWFEGSQGNGRMPDYDVLLSVETSFDKPLYVTSRKDLEKLISIGGHKPPTKKDNPLDEFEYYEILLSGPGKEKFWNNVKDKGYDGIVIRGGDSHPLIQNTFGGDQVIALYPSRVKQSGIFEQRNTGKQSIDSTVKDTLPPTQIKVNRGSKGVANITLPDADHAALFELDRQMKLLNNEKTYSQELEVSAEKLYRSLKEKFSDPIGTADTYRRSVLNGVKDIEKDGTYTAETFEAVKTKLDAEAKRFDIPVDKRTSKNVGDRKVNAMQYNHPELKPHIQEQAKNVMGDLAASLKAERGGTTVYGENTGPENISWGNKRMTTDTIAKILDEQKVSYADIDNALQRIVDDAGQENTALAKRIELLIDEHLTEGYTDIYGNKYPPVKEYVDAKNRAYGTDIRVKETKDMTDEDWAELEQLQEEIRGKQEVGSKPASQTKTMAEDIGLKPEKAGTYDEGTIGAAKLTVPEKQSVLPGTDEKVRSFNISIANSEIASPDVKIANIMEMYPGGLGAYTPIKLREVDVEAQNLISQNIEKATRFVLEGEEPSALKTATGIRLIEKYQNAGNYERAIDVSLAMAERLTKVGQEISAARIMGALKPDGILVFAQRQINKLNSGKKFGKDIELTPEMAKILKELANRLKNATDENARLEAGQELQGALNSLKPSGILRKIDSAQTISMLLNPKTLIRNTVGNEMFYRLERLNKIVATPIDWTVSKLTGADRQVTFRTAGQGGYWQGFFKGAKAGWKGVNPEGIQTQYDLGRSPAFNINPERAKNANTTTGKVVGGTFDFAEKTMAYLERTLGAALKGFDFAAYTRAKNNTIGELATLKAINTTGKADKTIVQGFMKDIEDNVLNIADQYGKYVTFQDNNVISRGLQGVKDALNINQDWGVGSVILKFPRTPGALIARGLEYSPAGFLKSAYELAKVTGIFKGNPSQRETKLALSRAITGTAGLTGLGYFLADQGIITGSIEKDKDLRELQRQTGQGQYRINLSALSRWVQSGFNKDTAQPIAGDKIINYDWAQPIAMALSIGANISKNLNDGQGKLDNISSTIAGSLEGALNTVAEQPVLQGLTRAVQGYDMGENVTNTVKNIPSSFAPTLANQVRQYIDNTTRSTYDPSWVEESKNKVKGKIPGIAGNLPVAYDTFGKPKEIYQDGGNDAFNVFFNPAFTSKYKVPEEAKLAIETFRNTGETKQLPRVVSKSFTISGQKIELTAQEYSDMQRIVGERTLREFSRIPQNASDDNKIRRMIDALGKAGLEGRKFVLQQRGLGFRKKGNGIVLKQQ